LFIGIPLLPGIAKLLVQISEQSPAYANKLQLNPVGTPPASTGLPTTQYPSGESQTQHFNELPTVL